MTRTKLSKLSLAVGMALLVWSAWSITAAQTGTIKISVEPPGARVVITGEGVTRVVEPDSESVLALEPGEYEIKVDSTGFKAAQYEVTLTGGENLTLRLMLVKAGGSDKGNADRFTLKALWTVLGFLLAFTLVLLAYLVVMQWRHYRSLDGALGSADEIGPEQTPAASGYGPLSVSDGAPKPLDIGGPGSLSVGHYSRPFTARAVDPAEWSEVDWTVEPADKAMRRRHADGRVSIIPSEPGVYKLNGSYRASDGTYYEGSVSVIALLRPPGSRLTIPWVGAGYGSILVAVIVVGVLLILGLTEVVDGDAIAPILGALIGYLFGVRAGGSGGTGE